MRSRRKLSRSLPDTDEFNRYMAAERFLESLREEVIRFSLRLVELVCERDLFEVVLGE